MLISSLSGLFLMLALRVVALVLKFLRGKFFIFKSLAVQRDMMYDGDRLGRTGKRENGRKRAVV